MRRSLAVFVLWVVVAAACAQAPAAEPPSSTTSTSLPPTTTTTEPPTTTTTVAVTGAPQELAQVVRAGLAGDPVPAPTELLEAMASHRMEGGLEAATGRWQGTELAVVAGPGLVLGAVGEEDGWRLVGGRVGETSVWPSLPAVYAVVGSDARPGEDPARSRADSIHLVGLPGDGSASLLGIPRDSWVPIAGAGTSKINSALANGGPEAMMATFEGVSGIELGGYVLTGFVGFQEMVGNVLGGFEMEVPEGFSDRASGADFEPGLQYFNGPAALAFSRARKAFEAGDFLRQRHGGLVLLGALGAVQLRGSLSIPALLEGSEEWLLTDLDPAQLLELALASADVDLVDTRNEVLPGSTTTRGGASVVVLAPGADAMFSDLADGRLED